jgi:hypothetical protein
MTFWAARSSQTPVEMPRRFRLLQFRGRIRRSASTAPDHPALVFAGLALGPALSSSCSRLMSRSIGQALPDDPAQRATGALYVVNAEGDVFVVTEIELGADCADCRFAPKGIGTHGAPARGGEVLLLPAGTPTLASANAARPAE